MPQTVQISQAGNSSLPDIPTSRSLPGTWRSSCFCSWCRSCCNCQPAHHTWSLEGREGRLGQGSPLSSPIPASAVSPTARSTTSVERNSLGSCGRMENGLSSGGHVISFHIHHSQGPAKNHQPALRPLGRHWHLHVRSCPGEPWRTAVPTQGITSPRSTKRSCPLGEGRQDPDIPGSNH